MPAPAIAQHDLQDRLRVVGKFDTEDARIVFLITGVITPDQASCVKLAEIGDAHLREASQSGLYMFKSVWFHMSHSQRSELVRSTGLEQYRISLPLPAVRLRPGTEWMVARYPTVRFILPDGSSPVPPGDAAKP